jgi:hypothetical protein
VSITASSDHIIFLWLIQTLKQAPGQRRKKNNTNIDASDFSQFFSGALCAEQLKSSRRMVQYMVHW